MMSSHNYMSATQGSRTLIVRPARRGKSLSHYGTFDRIRVHKVLKIMLANFFCLYHQIFCPVCLAGFCAEFSFISTKISQLFIQIQRLIHLQGPDLL